MPHLGSLSGQGGLQLGIKTMPISPENAVVWTGGGAAAITIITLVIRHLISNVGKVRLEAMETTAELGSYARMQAEIKRLSDRCEQLQKEIDELKAAQMKDIYDISSLTVLLSKMPCGNCDIPSETFREAESVLRGVVERRKRAVGV